MAQFPSILQTPDFVTLVTEQDSTLLQGQEPLQVQDVTVTICDGKITLQADTTPVCRLQLRWNGDMPDRALLLGDTWERAYGDLEWRGYVPHRAMPWYFLVLCDQTLAGYGVKTNPDGFCCFSCDPKGITLYIDLRCGGKGVVLGGKTLLCAHLVCTQTETDQVAVSAGEFVKQLATENITPDHPIYGFNNWYYAYGNSSHEEILENTKHLASLTRGLKNRPYMIIDDGWQVCRGDDYKGGPWRQGNGKFPDMAALASQIAELDVLPGIWFRPLQNIDQKIPEAWRFAERDDLLDPSVPEVLEYIKEDIRTLVDWGYKMIKHDFSMIDLMGGGVVDTNHSPWMRGDVTFTDRSKTTAMVIKDLYKAIHDATDGKALILGCNCEGHLGAGFMELNRTGDDTSGVVWEQTRKSGVNTLAFRMMQQGAWYAVDADCVGITKHIPWEKNRQWLRLLALSGTPLFVSVAPTTLNEEQNKELAQMLAVASRPRTVAQPLDFLYNTCPTRWLFEEGEETFDWFDPCGVPPRL